MAGVLFCGSGVIGPLKFVASRIVDEAGDDAEVGDGFAGGGGEGVDVDEGLGEEGDVIGCAGGESGGLLHDAGSDDFRGEGFGGGVVPGDVAGGVGEEVEDEGFEGADFGVAAVILEGDGGVGDRVAGGVEDLGGEGLGGLEGDVGLEGLVGESDGEGGGGEAVGVSAAGDGGVFGEAELEVAVVVGGDVRGGVGEALVGEGDGGFDGLAVGGVDGAGDLEGGRVLDGEGFVVELCEAGERREVVGTRETLPMPSAGKDEGCAGSMTICLQAAGMLERDHSPWASVVVAVRAWSQGTKVSGS